MLMNSLNKSNWLPKYIAVVLDDDLIKISGLAKKGHFYPLWHLVTVAHY